MIMLISHRLELREQLNEALQAKGHEIAIPPHRQDVMAVLKDCHPHLIILDLYLSDPSGVDVLKALRDHGYRGRVVMISGPSMRSVLPKTHPIGVDKVVQVPTEIDGQFALGELESAIDMCLKSDLQNEREQYRALIAKRAYELYVAGGCQDGQADHDWLRAERELAA